MTGAIRNGSLRVSLCLLFVIAACSGGDDGTGPDDNAEGTFTATVSGPITTSMSGFAWQSGTIVDSQTNERGWVLFMGTQSGTGSSVYVVRLGDRPGTGTYSFTDLTGSGDLESGQFAGIVTVVLNSGLALAGFASAGTITISSSSEQRVEGTFNIQFKGFDPNTQQEVTATASGSFSAVANQFAFPGF